MNLAGPNEPEPNGRVFQFHRETCFESMNSIGGMK